MIKVKILGLLGLLMISCYQCKETGKPQHEEYPILEAMGYYQRFSHKLYLAGMNQNWELADFYLHELEEVLEEVVEKEVIHDGYDISKLSASLLKPKLDLVDDAVRTKDEALFLENYSLMISGCNLCHQTTNHQFIKIAVPDTSRVWNQDFN